MENCQGPKCCGEPVCSSIKQENPEIAAIDKKLVSLYRREEEIESKYTNKIIEKLVSLISSGKRNFIIKRIDLCGLHRVDNIKSFAHGESKSFNIEGDLIYYRSYSHVKGELKGSDKITALHKSVDNMCALSFLLDNDSSTYSRIYSLSEDEYNEILSSKYSDSKKLFSKFLEIMDRDDLDDDIFKELRAEYNLANNNVKCELNECYSKSKSIKEKEYSNFFNDVEKRIENESLIGSYILFKDSENCNNTYIGKLDSISYDDWGYKRVIKFHLKNVIQYHSYHCKSDTNKDLYFTTSITIQLPDGTEYFKKISEEEYYFMKNVWLKNVEEKEETTNP